MKILFCDICDSFSSGPFRRVHGVCVCSHCLDDLRNEKDFMASDVEEGIDYPFKSISTCDKATILTKENK
jgi:hypothetical protein